LWLPDDQGIVGEVIQTGRPIRVDDAYADPRFDQSVDRQSGYRTQSLLCVPMRDGEGRVIGAFEAINRRGGPFTEDDLEALADLCLPASAAVQHSRERDQLLRSNQQLTERVTGQTTIIGESPAMVALRGTIARLAATDLPVLILGESGSGKEVAAQALHYQGPRAAHPFIAVNCAALTETLLESELFGHEKGAFTDAHTMRPGKFELADGGTLFLDEIGEMSPGGQAKLLRVLEQKVVTRVGGSQAIPINVRVIAATNSNLAVAVREKRFRQDLYYRLSVVTVDLPPLRERPEDVLPLARHFLEQFCRQAGRRPLDISPDARRRLQAHSWPGNVRELRNLMERVAFLCRSDQVEVEDLAFILAPQTEEADELAAGVGLSEATIRFQQEYIRKAIKRVQGNMSDAARLLGLHRSNLYRKMRQLGLEVEDVKS
jgi:Nif-specific regulatory protein